MVEHNTEKRPLNFLVTGASGFVGKTLCEHLLAHGQQVRRLVRSTPNAGDIAGDFVVGDLCQERDWSDALRGIDVVIHLAARVHKMTDDAPDPARAYHEANVLATQRLAEQALKAGVKRFVFVSSIKVNGEATPERPYSEADTPVPVDLYGQSKWQAEQNLMKLCAGSGMEWVIVRPALVYGENVGGNFKRLMRLIHARIPLPLGQACAMRSFVSVWNLADLLEKCSVHEAAAGRVFLASDVTVGCATLVRDLARAMNVSSLLLPVPVAWLKLAAITPGLKRAVDRLVGPLQVDAGLAARVLGWHPVVSYPEAIERTVRYFLDETRSKQQ